jgi:hypothetical protein
MAQGGSEPASNNFRRSRTTVRGIVALLLDEVEWGTISQHGRDEGKREGEAEMVGKGKKSTTAGTIKGCPEKSINRGLEATEEDSPSHQYPQFNLLPLKSKAFLP